MIESKPWIWNLLDNSSRKYWSEPALEFLPILQRWKDKSFSKVLDLGCGIGRHSIFLAQNGFKVDAFDLSQDGVASLNEKIKAENLEIKTQVGDMLNLPYQENEFDCILSFHVIHHTDLAGLKSILKSIHKILKPGGEAYLTFGSKQAGAWETYKSQRIDEFTLIKSDDAEIDVPHTFLDDKELQGILTDFEIISFQEIITYLLKTNERRAHFYVLMKKK